MCDFADKRICRNCGKEYDYQKDISFAQKQPHTTREFISFWKCLVNGFCSIECQSQAWEAESEERRKYLLSLERKKGR